jgi:tetratricopeptide (TPR) repeat protein
LIRELSALGKPALVDRVTGILRTTLEQLKGAWSQAHFAVYSSRVDALLGEGRITNACEAALSLVQIAKAAGGDAYEDADYDIAMACYLLGRALGAAERYEEALPLLDEAQSRFESVQRDDARLAAARMAVACATQRADCLASVYRLDEAAAIYEHSIGKWSELKDERNCAVAISQLGTVRRRQGRFDEALAAFATARRTFSGIDEPAWIANGYGESGVVYVALGRFQDAEVAYREALQIWVRIGDESGEAKQLENLATLYADHLNRVTEAVELYRRAADVFARLGDVAGEAYTRNNLAATLSQLGRFDEGRAEIERSLECKKPFGHSLQPWTSWDILATIERGAGNAAAATKAQQAALDSYLLFRREGGVIDGPGKLTGEVERRLQADGPAAALAFLKDLRGEPSSGPELQAFCDVLGAIVAGNLDRTAIVSAGLNYAAAAEALLMIERLDALARR